MRLDLTVALPSYREAANLARILPRLHDVLGPTGLRYELLVIDTPSALDETPALCREYLARHVCRAGGLEYGNAVRTGIREALGQYVVFMDADGSHPPEFVVKMLERRFDADIVVASRYVAGGGSDNGLALRAMSRLLNWSYGAVLGIKCRDVSNSFRLYQLELLKGLNLRCNDFDIVEEILMKSFMASKNLRLCEIPFKFLRREEGTSKRNLSKFVYSYVVTLFRLLALRLTA
ncbi:MAG: glycosyltransferase [Betaproteobacteria bacterium]|nr:MAG: glycosyltransferase [Betaproteobacteria bacterium]